MKHLYLIGFMGAGKTTVARLVSERLGRPFVDLDCAIETAAGCSVAEIFAEHGEAGFRERESAALAALVEAEPSVVACGGGVVLRDSNRAFIKQTGTAVLLEVTAAEALARIHASHTRPLLAGPAGSLAATSLLSARESLYRSSADIVVDTTGRTSSEVADAVISAYAKKEHS